MNKAGFAKHMNRGTAEEIAALKVGDTLYNFDGNRRVYARDAAGRSSGGPVYENHFDAVTITGETKISWVMGRYGAKVNKKTLASSMSFTDRGYFTKTGMEDDIWLHKHRYKIAQEVQTAGIDHLKEIARIIGYAP